MNRNVSTTPHGAVTILFGLALLLLAYESFARQAVVTLATIAVVGMIVMNEPTIVKELNRIQSGG